MWRRKKIEKGRKDEKSLKTSVVDQGRQRRGQRGGGGKRERGTKRCNLLSPSHSSFILDG